MAWRITKSRFSLRPEHWIFPALAILLPLGDVRAQSIVEAELTMLDARPEKGVVKSLPPKWTGGLEGLSLVHTFLSPLGAKQAGALTMEARAAARSICRKVGQAEIARLKADMRFAGLRFYVIELKFVSASLGPARAVEVKGLVFEPAEDCREVD